MGPRPASKPPLTVESRSIVVATNTPINDRLTIHTKQAAYRTYVVGLLIPKGSVPLGLYWDTTDPYHYIRLHPHIESEEVLIVGGEDHKTGQADETDRQTRLIEWARGWFPMTKMPAFQWSGQIIESIDGLGFIGCNPGEDNVYIATGDSGMGMTPGTIAGMLLTDLIAGRENRWADLYDPARVRARAASEFARENVNVAGQYMKWLKPGEVKRIEDIIPGQGAIVSKGTTKLAVYREPSGESHIRSAVCPHLKCIVGWNSEEQTWDCMPWVAVRSLWESPERSCQYRPEQSGLRDKRLGVMAMDEGLNKAKLSHSRRWPSWRPQDEKHDDEDSGRQKQRSLREWPNACCCKSVGVTHGI